MAETTTEQNDGVCSHCGQPLVRFKIGRYYRLQCDNAKPPCPLFHVGQGNIPIGDGFADTLDGLAAARRQYVAGNPARKGTAAP